MTRSILTRIFLSVIAFAVGVVGVVSYSVATADGNDRPEPFVTTDKAQAEQEAGYTIVTPGNLPPGMTLQAYIVDGSRKDGKSIAVDQYWHIDTGESAKQWISVMQGPSPAGLINGSAASFSGVEGERVEYGAETGRDYAIVELMWPQDGGFLYVAGSIVGTQTKDTLEQVASSLTTTR